MPMHLQQIIAHVQESRRLRRRHNKSEIFLSENWCQENPSIERPYEPIGCKKCIYQSHEYHAGPSRELDCRWHHVSPFRESGLSFRIHVENRIVIPFLSGLHLQEKETTLVIH